MPLLTPDIHSPQTLTDVKGFIDAQRRFFATGKTRDLSFRKEVLRRLQSHIITREADIASALNSDLGKSPQEAYLTESAMVLSEIKTHLRHLESWARPRRVSTPIYLWPSSAYTIYEPLGVALLMAPWNYPFQLVMAPLVGAIAAGCCVLIKPSPEAPATAALLQEIVDTVFDPGHVKLLQGGTPLSQELLAHCFDVIFFTGSPNVGRIVMRAAAEHLTPVVLELGGKSPCIVDRDADIPVAARRISWGKLLNAGQTCIAPDYILVHASIRARFLEELRLAFKAFLGNEPQKNPHYGRIIDARSYKRLQEWLHTSEVISGGSFSDEIRYLEPTMVNVPDVSSPLHDREIFGPLLPVYSFESIDEVVQRVNKGEKPLALYVFASSGVAEEVIRRTSSGGVCINDTIMHVAHPNLPFGGVGESGMGRYRGKYSFEAFSHCRSVLKSPRSFDLPMRYPPYRWFNWIRKLI